MNVLIVVTHLLGTGHLSRALTLGRAFAFAGHDVCVASGGMPVPQLDSTGLTLHHLPVLRSDGTDFTRLLTSDGTVADAPYLSDRTSALLALLDSTRPDILITELFPFGRRSLRAEFTALLEAARVRPRAPVILSSIRDILAPPSKPEKVTQTDALLTRSYDAVLVHSDPATTSLDQSWPVSPQIAPLLRYTGYVAPSPAGPHKQATGTGEVLVSAGGGDVGTPIFTAAIGAARRRGDMTWRLLVGGGPERRAALTESGRGASVIIEPPRPDFRQMLHHAAASVSMCGYNTTLDLLQADTPAVLIPFEAGNEVEQTLRGQSLAALSAMTVLPNARLTPDTLADAVAQVMAEGPRPTGGLNFDGAAQSVCIATRLAETRP